MFTVLRMTTSVHIDGALDVETLISNENEFLAEHDFVEIGCDQDGWGGRSDTLRRRVLRANVVGRLRGDGLLREIDLCPAFIVRLEVSHAQLPNARHIGGASQRLRIILVS